MAERLVLGFVPVLHDGYLRFFRRHAGEDLGILGLGLYSWLEPLTREIRAVSPFEMATVVRSLKIFRRVGVYCRKDDMAAIPRDSAITMPDEDVSRGVAERFLPGWTIAYEPWQLRYDMPATLTKSPPQANRQVTAEQFHREMVGRAAELASHSPDWWRQVGCIIVQNGQAVLGDYNTHMPSPHSLYALGDPRGNFVPGQLLDITCAHHAERRIIAKAARLGIALDGADAYVTVFPCPSCAYSIIEAGFRRIYYAAGYSSVDADKTLRAHGVEVVNVLM